VPGAAFFSWTQHIATAKAKAEGYPHGKQRRYQSQLAHSIASSLLWVSSISPSP